MFHPRKTSLSCKLNKESSTSYLRNSLPFPYQKSLKWHQSQTVTRLFTIHGFMYSLHVSSFLVTCSPACQNGGYCYGSSSSPVCHCPSGYNGSYCQSEGIINTHTTRSSHATSNSSVNFMLRFTSACSLQPCLSEWRKMLWCI